MCRLYIFHPGAGVPSTQTVGRRGEQDVVELCPCPNCTKPLMTLPTNYPLFDIQCTACAFRAQVKTVRSRPTARIRGAGWQVMNKVLKCGFLVPALVVNWTWRAKGKLNREIRLYPFIPRKNLHRYALSASARQAHYEMFEYTGLRDLPSFELYKGPNDERG